MKRVYILFIKSLKIKSLSNLFSNNVVNGSVEVVSGSERSITFVE